MTTDRRVGEGSSMARHGQLRCRLYEGCLNDDGRVWVDVCKPNSGLPMSGCEVGPAAAGHVCDGLASTAKAPR